MVVCMVLVQYKCMSHSSFTEGFDPKRPDRLTSVIVLYFFPGWITWAVWKSYPQEWISRASCPDTELERYHVHFSLHWRISILTTLLALTLLTNADGSRQGKLQIPPTKICVQHYLQKITTLHNQSVCMACERTVRHCSKNNHHCPSC